MPSAIVRTDSTATGSTRLDRGDEGSAGLDLDADDLHLRALRPDRDRDPADQAASTDGHHDAREVRHLAQQLQPDPALPGDHIGIVERVDELHAGLGRALPGGGDALVDRPAHQVQRRAERLHGVRLGDRRRLRHEHLARHATRARRVGDRLGVVSGAPADDAARGLIAQRGDLGHRAAQLEGAGALEVLRLQHDPRPGALGERARS